VESDISPEPLCSEHGNETAHRASLAARALLITVFSFFPLPGFNIEYSPYSFLFLSVRWKNLLLSLLRELLGRLLCHPISKRHASTHKYIVFIARLFRGLSRLHKRSATEETLSKYLSRSLRAIRASVIVEKWSPDFFILNFITYREFNEARVADFRSDPCKWRTI